MEIVHFNNSNIVIKRAFVFFQWLKAIDTYPELSEHMHIFFSFSPAELQAPDSNINLPVLYHEETKK